MSVPNHWIDQIHRLPVLPQVAMRITERIQSPTATVREISDLIKSDIGLTSTILRLANSSYYSIPGGVSDIAKALQYLGFTTIAQSVLTSSLFGTFKTKGLKEFPLSQFWVHSFAVGLLAEISAQNLQFKNPGDSFIAGLMHDVGKLALLEISPEDLAKVIRYAETHESTFLKAEQDLECSTHMELGAEFGKHWNLPDSVISAIRFHHGGSSKKEDLLIQWANLWVHRNQIGSSGSFSCADTKEDETFLAEKIGINSTKLELIEKHFKKEFEKAGALLNGN